MPRLNSWLPETLKDAVVLKEAHLVLSGFNLDFLRTSRTILVILRKTNRLVKLKLSINDTLARCMELPMLPHYLTLYLISYPVLMILPSTLRLANFSFIHRLIKSKKLKIKQAKVLKDF